MNTTQTEDKQKTPRMALNKAFLKLKPSRIEIDKFKIYLSALLDNSTAGESEEFHKNEIADFLKNTYYAPRHFINTKGRNDLVIHNGDTVKSHVGIIIEAKSPTNKAEMPTCKNLNSKALQELVLYYLRERITNKNIEIKQLIITNTKDWFVFDAREFDRFFAQDKALLKDFQSFNDKTLVDSTTDFFYKNIASPAIEKIKNEIELTYFRLQDFEAALRSDNLSDDKALIPLYKIFSPEHLLKLPFVNDSNTLDQGFYNELLHIVGLTEVKEGGKKLIQRKEENERLAGSLLENAIMQFDSLDKLRSLKNGKQYGNTKPERLFNIGLELSITWINRILFLKLLEAQLMSYHKGDAAYSFLNLDKIKNYGQLNELFFQVLARQPQDRIAEVQAQFAHVPYLNSSLFEMTELEQEAIFISNLNGDKTLPILTSTVLKDRQGKNRKGKLGTLAYLFEFLNAYDFASDGTEEVQEENKSLINASVLGLIFEKINGYQDGSFFTPGFITMYMCRETLHKAVIQKFNEAKQWDCASLDDVYDKLGTDKAARDEANAIINSLKICDPAVGSGHFLVSALNELIAVKQQLGILQDKEGKRLKHCQIEVVNDELLITDNDDELYNYAPNNKESQRIQETLFHEKQTIIENCLFGVDINPNSVKICRLRLWIELLKNAYYKTPTELETLPNIDINIKCGNSLVSRFGITADIKPALKKSKLSIEGYRLAVAQYRNANNKDEKRDLEALINKVKEGFQTEIANNNPDQKRLKHATNELAFIEDQAELFEMAKKEQAEHDKKVQTLTAEIQTLSAKIEAILSNKIYIRAFEWRFEFPEVLNDEGDFIGFDVVIGNPPYIRHEAFTELKPYLKDHFEIFHSSADLLTYFVELSHNLLKNKGFFNYIISGKFVKAQYGLLMRQFLTEKTDITHFIDFGGKSVFDEATVDAAIISFIKQMPIPENQLIYRKVLKEDEVTVKFNDYMDKNAGTYPCQALSASIWSFDNPLHASIIQKINEKGTPLSHWNITINFGIKTGFNEAFVIDEAKKNELIAADPKSANIIQPLLRGRDIQKYVSGEVKNWLIGTYNGNKTKQNGIDIEDYPTIKNWLDFHGDKIDNRYDQGDTKYNLRHCAYWEDFKKPKLIWKRIGSILRFCYDESGAYCLDSTCIATGEKVKFLTAVLNSTFCKQELFRLSPKTGTGDLIISVQALDRLRVPLPNEKQEKDICDLLNKIIKKKTADTNANTSELESQIDVLVYDLYGLTEAEIGMIKAN